MVNEVDVGSISSLGSIYRKEEIVVSFPLVKLLAMDMCTLSLRKRPLLPLLNCKATIIVRNIDTDNTNLERQTILLSYSETYDIFLVIYIVELEEENFYFV